MSEWLFSLRKLAPRLFLPLWLSLIFIGLAILTRKRRYALVAFVGLCVASLPPTGSFLFDLLESQYPRIQPDQCPRADAIVVLGGSMDQVSGRTEYSDAADRFEWGVRLFRMGKAPVLIFTGAELPGTGYNEGRLQRDLAVEHGIPADSIRVTSSVYNTETEAASVHGLLAGENRRSFILVTSAFHMPRSVLLFRREGLQLTPFPVDYRSGGKSRPVEKWAPSADALNSTDTALMEIYANILYRLKRLVP